MREFPKPVVVVSKCLGFAACRWNGVTIPDRFVESLKPYVEFRPVCPEMEIGLGVPRDPIRVVQEEGELRLIQPASGRDVTREMMAYAEDFLEAAGEVDGFLLKSRSPSCGFRDVKIYPCREKCAAISSKGHGFFGGTAALIFDYKAIEDEARLGDFHIRENYLTKLFTIADFRRVYESGSINELIDFHARNKYLLMAISQSHLKVLGKVVAGHMKGHAEDVIQEYADEIIEALTRPPKYKTIINAMMHAFGHFSKELKKEEKEYFLEMLEKYRNAKVPMSLPLGILRSFVVRFDDEYLKQQTFFEPFPDELVTVTDSGKGRERR
jgi:uncharacterized protein YbgA (DUF1722 family)/uncharacterized protein YbbK (DUF523 family)